MVQRVVLCPGCALSVAVVAKALTSVFGPLSLEAQQIEDDPSGWEEVVDLIRVADRPCEDPGGWSNLFFEPTPGTPSEAVALFAETDLVPRVEVLQRQTLGGDTIFSIRSSDDRNEHPLEFMPTQTGRCATVEMPMASFDAGVRLQVLLADGWTYGRIAEHREGILPTAEGPTRMELHPRMRSAVGFDQLSELVLFVDQNRAGEMRRRTALDTAGQIQLSDEAGEAFLVGNERFSVDSVSSDGRRLHVRRVGDVTAPFRGFRAPVFVGTDIHGNLHHLDGYTGRTVVIEFWSTECVFSEQARPEAQRLAGELEAQGGVFLSMPREADVAHVREHLIDHPREGIVLPYDEATWENWNPQTATPLYYVIAPDGSIVLREMGASAIRIAAVAAGIDPDRLRSSPRERD
jgi:thiol-disulfide isomerase/thioredoxin